MTRRPRSPSPKARALPVSFLAWVALLSIALAGPAAASDETPAALLEELSDGSVVELPALDPSVPSPAAFLGYPLGARFTHHEEIVHYLDHLAATSNRVVTWRYGTTYENRPLQLVAISTPENLARLDTLKSELGELATGRGASSDSLPIVIWLAYGVHGNESSSSEAAMAAAWVFAAARGEWNDLLENAIILIDPLCNPDGRERYVHFFETRRGREADPLAVAAEHVEDWPGGRQNHYLVDLNRDWAWMTQVETQARIRAYRDWEPQVYVDFHEMAPTSSYFFPPSADPVHPHINPRAMHWLERFGRSNAAAFDRRGWIYYVGERFDLFYPGYGDSYPSLRGAIGMTYEMAGHGRAGQVFERPDGSLLTLADRIARHLTTSIATARTAIDNRVELLNDFARFRDRSIARSPSTYLWPPDQQEARAAAELLTAHGIEVRQLEAETTVRGRRLLAGEQETRAFPAGTYTVSTRQPLGNLARSLLDLEAAMPEAFLGEQRRRVEQNRSTQFYDITAWSLPLAFNLDTWIATGTIAGAGASDRSAAGSHGGVRGDGELGFLIPPQGLSGFRFAGALQRHGIAFRLALNGFELGDKSYPSGTLFVPRSEGSESLDATVNDLSRETGIVVDRTATGYAEAGSSLGSDSAVAIRPVRTALIGGRGVEPTSFGFLWHLLDRQVQTAHHRLAIESLAGVNLADFDVLVLPSGNYERALRDQTAEAIESWVRDGGLLIAVGDAVDWLRKRELTGIKAWTAPKPEGSDNEVTPMTPANREIHTPGAALATSIERPHPLTAGLHGSPPALYDDKTVLLATGNPRQDVVRVAGEEAVIAGFAWPEAEERLSGSLLVGLESKGKGAVVVFSQEPSFRLFWRGTAPVFLNAVLYGPSLLEHGKLR